MTNPLLTPKVIEALGLEETPEEDQLDLLTKHGDEIFETALIKFTALLSESEQQELHAYLAADPEPEVLIHYLLNEYEQFANVLRSASQEVRGGATGE